MHVSSRHVVQLFFLLSTAAFLLVASQDSIVRAQTGIPPGCRQPTSDDIAAGLPPDRPVCAPDSTTVGDSGEAKRYLASLLRGGTCGPYRTTFEQINPQFAVCAAKFLKNVQAQDPRIHIVSAYRSAAHQAYLCGGGCGRVNGPCAAAGNSRHQSGLAMDISVGTHIVPGWIQAMGRGYGVHFPVRNDSGHMEPMPGSNCADPNFRPTETAGRPPTSGIANAARQVLNIPSYNQSFALNPQQEQNCTLSDGSVVPCSAIANQGGAPPGAAQSGGGATAPQQALPASQQPFSTMQDSPKPVSNLITPPATNNPIAPGSAQPTSTSTKYSAFELIGFLAAPEQTAVATSAPFVLTVSAKDAKSIGQTPRPALATQTSEIYQPLPGIVEQTFTSPDLRYGYQNVPSPKESVLQSLLAQFHEILVKALQLLRPFGRIYGPEDVVVE